MDSGKTTCSAWTTSRKASAFVDTDSTIRYLYLLQVIEAEPQRQQVTAAEGLTMDGVPFDPTRPVAPPPQNGNRRAATSMDDMEREFRRKKERELQAARMAGAG